jgi:hypothetical protein
MYIIGKRLLNPAATIELSSKPVIHPSITKADTEAERLARLYPGYEFVVFGALKTASIEPVRVQWTNIE